MTFVLASENDQLLWNYGMLETLSFTYHSRNLVFSRDYEDNMIRHYVQYYGTSKSFSMGLSETILFIAPRCGDYL